MRRVTYMVGARDFSTLKAEHFMQDAVSYFHVDDSGERLAEAMTDGGFGSVPILGMDHKVVGIVSEYDVLKAIMEGKELAKVTAREIMTKNPITVNQDTPVTEIMCLLQEKHLIRMPVVDDEGKLAGVVSRRDIMEGYLRASKPLWRF